MHSSRRMSTTAWSSRLNSRLLLKVGLVQSGAVNSPPQWWCLASASHFVTSSSAYPSGVLPSWRSSLQCSRFVEFFNSAKKEERLQPSGGSWEHSWSRLQSRQTTRRRTCHSFEPPTQLQSGSSLASGPWPSSCCSSVPPWSVDQQESAEVRRSSEDSLSHRSMRCSPSSS